MEHTSTPHHGSTTSAPEAELSRGHLARLERERGNRNQVRHGMLLDCFRHVLADASVLCLGAGDGQWCIDVARAGALHVLGYEAQADLVSRFHRMPQIGARERVDLRHETIMSGLEAEVARGARYEAVFMMDALRDQTNLWALFAQVAKLQPRIVQGDGMVAQSLEPVFWIEQQRGRTQNEVRPHLIPSIGAVDLAAEAAGFDIDWTDWTQVPDDMRDGLSDYYRKGNVSRASFTLIPRDG